MSLCDVTLSSFTLSTSSLVELSNHASSTQPTFSDEKIKEVVLAILAKTTKKQLISVKYPPERVNRIIVNACIDEFKKIEGCDIGEEKKKELAPRIRQCLCSPELPIDDEILDCLILDPLWQEKVEKLGKRIGIDNALGIEIYVYILIQPKIEEIKTLILNVSEKSIKRKFKDALKDKSVKKELKSLESTQKKVEYLTSLCGKICCKYLNIKEKELEPVLKDLKKRRFSKQEIAAKQLPGGRNMLKDYIEDYPALNSLVYEQLPERILNLFLRIEKTLFDQKFSEIIKKSM